MKKFKQIGLGFSALVLSLSTVLMPATSVRATGEEEINTCETAREDGACVGDWGTLSEKLKDSSVKYITLSADIETSASMYIMRGVTINGQNHTIKSTANVAVYMMTANPVVLQNLNVDALAAGSYGMYIYAKYSDGTYLKTYNVTLDHSSLRSNGYGIYDVVKYYRSDASDYALNIINGSKVEWIGTDGNPVANKTTDVAANTTLKNGYSYGLMAFGLGDGAVWTISDSEVSGYRYASQFSQSAAGAKLNIEGSYLNASRSDIDVFASGTEEAPFVVNVKKSTLHGINLYGGTSENYANVLFEKDTNYVDMTFEDTEFTVYENDTALDNYFASQYAITNRAYGSTNTNKAAFRGNSSYIVSNDYLTRKAQFSNFQEEPTWGTDEAEAAVEETGDWDTYKKSIIALGLEKQKELRSTTDEDGDVLTRWTTNDNPANTGIVVYGGTYSYNPKEFVADGYSVVKNDDGTYSVTRFYNVTVEEVENGTVTASVEKAEAGDEVTVTATPAKGYALEKITVNDEAIESNTFTMPAEDVTVVATFVSPVTVKEGTYYAELGKTVSYADLGVETELAGAEIGHNEVAGLIFNTDDKTVTVSDGKGGDIVWTYDGEEKGTSTLSVYGVRTTDAAYDIMAGGDVSYNVELVGDVEAEVVDPTIAEIIKDGEYNIVKGLKVGTTTIKYTWDGKTIKEIPVAVYTVAVEMTEVQAVGTAQIIKVTADEGYEVVSADVAPEAEEAATITKNEDGTFTLTVKAVPTVKNEEGEEEVVPVTFFVNIMKGDKAMTGGTYSVKAFELDVNDNANEDEEEVEGNESVLKAQLDEAIAAIVDDYANVKDGNAYTIETEDGEVKFNVTNAAALKAAIEQGGTVTVEITEPGEVSYADGESTKVAELLSEDAEIVGHLDISVVLKADDAIAGYVTELDQEVEITLDVSSLTKVEDGYKRNFYVVRYHNDEAEKLDVEYDEENGTITFKSDKFSSFTVAYTDELIASVDTGVYTVFATGMTETSGIAAIVVTAVALMVLVGLAKFVIDRR